MSDRRTQPPSSRGEPEAPPLTVISAANVIDLRIPEPVIWADEVAPHHGVLCSVGEPMILSAPGGVGKSWILLHLSLVASSAVEATPARACGLEVRPGPVLYVGYEDSPARLGGRLRALTARDDVPAADLRRLFLVVDPLPLWAPPDHGRHPVLPTAAWHELQEHVVNARPKYSLIVIDPLGAALGGADVGDMGAARFCMSMLAALSAKSGAGVACVAHDTKAARTAARAGKYPGAGAVAGSGQWHDAARGVVYLHRTDNGGRALECVKANHGKTGWGRVLKEVVDQNEIFLGFGTEAPIQLDLQALRDAAADDDNDPYSVE